MTEKDQRWVFHGDALPQSGGPGHPHTQITYVVKGVFSFTIDGETRTVRAGDTMLKTDSVVHGCVCQEAGVLLDIFTPMRADFV